MNVGQKFLKIFLPRSLFDALRRGTRSFLIECPCGYQRDLWEAGGAKGAGNQELTFKECPECKRWRWHKKRKKTAEELDRFPMEPHPDGSLEFGPKRDGWANALVWGSAVLIWASGVMVMIFAEPHEGAIAINLAIIGGLIAPWFWATTSYHLSATELRMQSGCFSTTLRLPEIRRVRPVRGGIGISYAFSLNTLSINVLGKRLSYRIAPTKPAEFLEALAERCPHLRWNGTELNAGDMPSERVNS